MDLQITITGWDRDRLHALLVERLETEIETLFNAKLAEVVEERVLAMVDKVAEGTVRPLVDEAIAEGWQKTNEYGEPRGPKQTLKERIAAMLTENVSRGYGSDAQTRAEKIASGIVEDVFRKEFANEIEAAKKKARGLFESKVQERLGEAIKQAFGVR